MAKREAWAQEFDGEAVMMIILAVAALAIIGFFGSTGVVAHVATAALLLVPTIFTISVVFGFVSRRQSWFR